MLEAEVPEVVPEVEEVEPEEATETVLSNKEEESKLLGKHLRRLTRTSQPYEQYESLILSKE